MDEDTVVVQPEKSKPSHLWKKGQSGNPAGKPKNSDTLAAQVRKILYTVGKSARDGIDRTVLDEMILSLAMEAVNGDTKAVEILLDRGFGKATQFLEIKKEETFVFDWGDDTLVEGEVTEDDNENISQLTEGTSSKTA